MFYDDGLGGRECINSIALAYWDNVGKKLIFRQAFFLCLLQDEENAKAGKDQTAVFLVTFPTAADASYTEISFRPVGPKELLLKCKQ